MTQRNRKIRFLKTLLMTTALFACPAIAEDYISIIDQGNGALLIQNGGTFPRNVEASLGTTASDLLKNATTVTIDTTSGSSQDFTTEGGGIFAVGLKNPADATSLAEGTLVFKNLGTVDHKQNNFAFKARDIQIDFGNFMNNAGKDAFLTFAANGSLKVGKNTNFATTAGSIILFSSLNIDFGGSMSGDGTYNFISGSGGTINFNSENLLANTIRFLNGPTAVINGKWDFVKEFTYSGKVLLNNDITVGSIRANEDAYLSGNHTLTINAATDSLAYFANVGQYDSASDNFSDPLKELKISTTVNTVAIGTIPAGANTFYVQKMSVGGVGAENVSFAATNGKIEDLLLTNSKATVYSKGKTIIDKLTLSNSTLTVGEDGVLVLGDVTRKLASKLALSLHSTLLYKNGGTLDLSTLDLTAVTGTSDVYATIGNYSDSTALTFAADADKYKNIIAKGYVDLNNSAFYGIGGGNWVVSSGTVKADFLYADTAKTSAVKSGAVFNPSKIVQTPGIFPTYKVDGQLNVSDVVVWDKSFSRYDKTKWLGTLTGGGTVSIQSDIAGFTGVFDNLGTLRLGADLDFTGQNNANNANGSTVIKNLVFSSDKTFNLLAGKLTVNALSGSGKIKLNSGSTLYFDVNGTLPANIVGTGTLGLLNSSKLELSDAAVGNLTLEGLEIDGGAEAVIKADISIDKLKFMQDTGGTLGIDSGKTLTVKSGVTMRAGNTLESSGGDLILKAESTLANAMMNNGTLTTEALTTFTSGKRGSVIQKFIAGGDIAIEAGASLAVLDALNLSDGHYVYGDGSLTVGADGIIGGGKFDGTITVGQNKVTVASDMTLGTFKFTQSEGGTLWIDDNTTLTVGKLQGVGSNTVRGGILKLLSGGEIGNVTIEGELSFGDSTAITGDSVIDTVTSAGDIFIADGVTLTVNKKLDLSTGNIVYGDKGTLALNGTDNQIATKTKILGTLKIGENGAVTFYDDAVVGTLDSRGTTTVAAGKTLEIRQSYSGKLSAADATLKLTEAAQGTFTAGDGSVIGALELAGDNARATFNGAYELNDLTLSQGRVEINDVLTLANGTFTGGAVGGAGSLKLTGTLTIGTGADVSISNLTFDANGKLRLNGQLTVNNELDYRGHLIDAGNGTLTLGAKGTFGGTFMGTVRVGQTTAEIAKDAVFKALCDLTLIFRPSGI